MMMRMMIILSLARGVHPRAKVPAQPLVRSLLVSLVPINAKMLAPVPLPVRDVVVLSVYWTLLVMKMDAPRTCSDGNVDDEDHEDDALCVCVQQERQVFRKGWGRICFSGRNSFSIHFSLCGLPRPTFLHRRQA